MKFLVDANLPPAFTGWLVFNGHEAQHVSDVGLASASDRAIWRYACDHDACIVTKDEDFVLMQAIDRLGPGVVWIRIGNAVRSVLLRRLPLYGPTLLLP